VDCDILASLDGDILVQCSIERVLIPTRCIFFFGSLSQKNLEVKRAWPRAILGWVTDRKFSRVCMSEDKVCTKDSCWCVGMIYDPRELPEVSIVGSKVYGVLQLVSEPTLTVSRACVGLGVRAYGAWRMWARAGHLAWHMMILDILTWPRGEVPGLGLTNKDVGLLRGWIVISWPRWMVEGLIERGLIPTSCIFVGVSKPGGVPGPMSEMSPRAPAPMGRRKAEREGGKGSSRREAGV
jgi:hypothetical protein